MRNPVAIIDYGLGNLDSIFRAVEECGGNPILTSGESSIRDASHIILPGVGAFIPAMDNIERLGLDTILSEQVTDYQKPLLGICLGMQLLASRGWEGGEREGLDLIRGEIRRLIPQNENERIPHIGWNNVDFRTITPLLEDLPSGKDFYFVHSYHFIVENPDDQIASTPYCGTFASIVGHDNIFGVQFHPEKSQKPGLKLIRNFITT